MKEPRITKKRIDEWTSSMCRCHVTKFWDIERYRLWVRACDKDHRPWALQVAEEYFRRKKLSLGYPKQKVLDDILAWKDDGAFMRPSFGYASNGLFADQCYWDWDSGGITLPASLEDPERLNDLVQAKKNREFTISEWLENYYGTFERKGEIFRKRDEYPIWPEEYMSHPGMSKGLFRTLFHRDPNPDLIEILS